jgi:hypothetical protein
MAGRATHVDVARHEPASLQRRAESLGYNRVRLRLPERHFHGVRVPHHSENEREEDQREGQCGGKENGATAGNGQTEMPLEPGLLWLFKNRIRAHEFIPPAGIISPHQHDLNIHDVGARRAGANEIAERLEKMIRVVARQRIGGTQSLLCRPSNGSPVGNRAGGIGGAIGAVGTRTEQDDVSHSGNIARGCKDEFLIASA